ncbi:MAG TPA: hypothetical protein VGB18_06190, partial [Candidatus Thermoplasmatota archaeon]
MVGKASVVLITILLSLASLLAPAEAQSRPAVLPGTKEISITDPPGDVKWTTQAGNQTPPTSTEYLDVLRLWMNNETLDEIELGIQLDSLTNPSPQPFVPVASRSLAIEFFFGESHYFVTPLVTATGEGCGGGVMSRRVYLDATRTSYTGNSYCIKAESDLAEGTIRFFLPRHGIRNETNKLFGPGDVLVGLHTVVRTYDPAEPFFAFAGQPSSTGFEDRAPDLGVGPEFRSTLGEAFSAGDLRLFAENPVRVSNGESTTFVYTVSLSNHGDATATVSLEAANVLDGWIVRVPARLDVPAKQTIEFPVILSMGFSHSHSDIVYFQVRAQHLDDLESHSEINLGVFWTDIPQPAGHHNKLWLHSGTGRLGYGLGIPFGPMVCEYKEAWLSALEVEIDPNAVEEEIAPCTWDTVYAVVAPQDTLTNTVRWSFPMRPSLLIGLDFDIDDPGNFVTSVRSPVAVTRAELSARLMYYTPQSKEGCEPCNGQSILLAEGRAPARAMSANTPAQFEVPLAFLKEADLLPYAPQSNLYIALSLSTDTPNHVPNVSAKETAPAIIPKDTVLTLPLLEYHDPVDQAFDAVGSMGLVATGPFEKFVNPGKGALFGFEVVNNGVVAQDVMLQIEGHNRDWARFLEGESISLGVGEKRNVTLLVEVPDSASAGERAELFAVAQSKADANVVALARLRASVIPEEQQSFPDERPLLGDAAGGVPGPSLIAFLAVL